MKTKPTRKPRRLLMDLPGDADVSSHKLKLPAKALKAFLAYAGGEPAMYPVGCTMGYGFMMSPEPPSSPSRRLYPLPDSIAQRELLNWEIVE